MRIKCYLFIFGIVCVKVSTGQESPSGQDTVKTQLPKQLQYNYFKTSPVLNFETETKLFPENKLNFTDNYQQIYFSKKNNLFNKLKPYYVPATLLFFSLYSVSDEAAQDSPFDKYEIQKGIQNSILFRSNIDDYLRYAPLAITGGLKIAGIKGRSDGLNTAILSAKANFLTGLIVTNLKRTTNFIRPDGSSYTSFPSGHTATAFCNATIMHMEMKDESIWYSVAAYSMATATGAMRLINNKHWLPDVLAGAAIGIASTRFVYATHRYRWGKKPSNLTVAPTLSGKNVGLYLSYKF